MGHIEIFSDEERERIAKAKIYLDERLPLHTLPNELAQYACLSESRFRRGFKEMYGESFYAYQLNARLKKAYELLEKTKLPIKKVALETGFTPANLAKAFRKKYKLSPVDFRK